MRLRRFHFWFILGICLCVAVIAQGPIQPVQWGGSVATKVGWNVYGLVQPSGGPTPRHVALDDNEAAQAAGAVSGTAPTRKHDPSLDLETQVYTRSFILHLPVQVKQHPAAGKQSVSVSVRFQACSDRICLPPRTVHVPVPIEIR